MNYSEAEAGLIVCALILAWILLLGGLHWIVKKLGL